MPDDKQGNQDKKMKPIFKKEQKLEYISYLGGYENEMENFFSRIYNKESEYGKDIADMNYDELRDTLVALNICKLDTRRHFLSFIRRYINWAMLFDKTDNESPINDITAESIRSNISISSQMIGSPEHLNEIMYDSMPRADDGSFLYPKRAARDQLVFWLLYNGLELERLAFLKKTELNIEKKIIVSDNKEFAVDDKTISLWREVCLNDYIEGVKSTATASRKNAKTDAKWQLFNDETTENNYKKCQLVDNFYLFRPRLGKAITNEITSADRLCSKKSFIALIYKIVQQYNRNTGSAIRLSPENIRISGMFYSLYLIEKCGEIITPEILAEKFNLNVNASVNQAKQTVSAGRLIADYEDWRLAFGYVNQII